MPVHSGSLAEKVSTLPHMFPPFKVVQLKSTNIPTKVGAEVLLKYQKDAMSIIGANYLADSTGSRSLIHPITDDQSSVFIFQGE